MSDFLIPRRDLAFLLYDVLDVEALTQTQRYAQHDRLVFESVLDTAEAIARDHFATHAAKVDQSEPQFDGQAVSIIPEVKTALDAYVGAGLMGATFDEQLGGLQLPMTIDKPAKLCCQRRLFPPRLFHFLPSVLATCSRRLVVIGKRKPFWLP